MAMPPGAKGVRPALLAGVQVTCIVPSLNEYDNLMMLLPKLADTLSAVGVDWDIVVVDDGSTDDTPRLMTEWSNKPGFSYLQLSRNFGKEAALSAGLEVAQGQVVILIDADLQHPVELLPRMLERWLSGVDNVYAVRANRADEGWIKRVGSRLFYHLLHGSGRVHIPPDAGDFRLFDRQVVDALLRLPERNRFMKGLYAWVGFGGEAIEYTPAERLHGSSRFNLFRLLRLALSGLTAFTTWPLRLVSFTGLLVAALSLIYGCYLVVDYEIHGHPLSGWTTIVTIQLFSVGVILVSIGIVGEYVARIFEEVKGRPLYLVRQYRGSPRSKPHTDGESSDD